jgi:hypothetical protein
VQFRVGEAGVAAVFDGGGVDAGKVAGLGGGEGEEESEVEEFEARVEVFRSGNAGQC